MTPIRYTRYVVQGLFGGRWYDEIRGSFPDRDDAVRLFDIRRKSEYGLKRHYRIVRREISEVVDEA